MNRRSVLRGGALGLAAAAAVPATARAQAKTGVMMTVTGGCVYAFKPDRTLDVLFPTTGHEIVLRAAFGTIKDPSTFPASWKVGSQGLKIPGGYNAWFAGASGPIAANCVDCPPSNAAPEKGSEAWEQLGYVLDLSRRFKANAALALGGKKYLSFALAGGYFQAGPPSESLGFDALWTVERRGGPSTEKVTQPLTDRTSWATALPSVKVAFAKQGQTTVEHSVEFVPKGPGVHVALELAGSSAGSAPDGAELKHFSHLFGLLKYDGTFGNPHGALQQPSRGAPPPDVTIRTPGRFCPGLQITTT